MSDGPDEGKGRDRPEPVRPGGRRPEAVRPGAPGAPEDASAESDAPLSVRDLMKTMTPAPEAEGEPRWEGGEHGFEMDGEEWTVRSAGAGSYGTGSHGKARLLAVHFYRNAEPERPVREALVPAGRFGGLRESELRALFEEATPIELDR